ncbi:glycosyltransferase [Kribbella sp. DT2]|uniref:glycosyltransferase n=1 Tax=Kribbella sp. DT2 TaxID=3393427 RepID=UPI003CF1D38B
MADERQSMHVRNDAMQTLWVGSSLSALEQLSLASFVKNGHDVHLYVYEEVRSVPAGVGLRDAGTILPEDQIFTYGSQAGPGKGSVAAFANLFRYKMLLEKGGWWFDSDMICLKPFDFAEPYVFARQDDVVVNNAVLRVPAESRLMERLYDRATKLGRDLSWGETGPQLLTEQISQEGLEDFVLPSDTFYPVGYWSAPDLFRADPGGQQMERLEGSYGVHLWNEILRRAKIDKEATFASSSVVESLKRRYC